MQRLFCKSKIHGATVTEARLEYQGSIAVDALLLEVADIAPYEMVQVLNLNNGERFETYAIPSSRGDGQVCLNGAAARLGVVGDKVIILSSCMLDEKELASFKPKIVFVDNQNRIQTTPSRVQIQ